LLKGGGNEARRAEMRGPYRAESGDGVLGEVAASPLPTRVWGAPPNGFTTF